VITKRNRGRLAPYLAVALGVFEASRFIGPWAWAALPFLLGLVWVIPETGDDGELLPPLDAPPGISQTHWLEDAYGSWMRGTHVTTLAVRYDLDPSFLEDELERIHLAAQAADRRAAGTTHPRGLPIALR
jgi:hypothetical protein